MGTPLSGNRQQFYNEDFNSGVSISQAIGKKLGSNQQFINDNFILVYEFFASGPYSIATPTPFTLGFPEILEKDYTIDNIWVGNETTGTGTQTEIDLKRAVLGSGTFNTLFTTTPKFDSTSASGAFVDHEGVIVATPTGVTRPVLNTTDLSAGDRLQLSLITALTGGRDVWLKLHLKPR